MFGECAAIYFSKVSHMESTVIFKCVGTDSQKATLPPPPPRPNFVLLPSKRFSKYV
jgi:hypothetical protein